MYNGSCPIHSLFYDLKKKNDNEVEAITGATISSKAVVRLLNNTVAIWQTAIDDYIKENNISISKKDE